MEIPEGERCCGAKDGSFGPNQVLINHHLSDWGSVQVGQVIGLIEVMKTFTPIKATKTGILQRWTLEEGGACQVGQPIAILG